MHSSDTNYLASLWQDSLKYLKKSFNSNLYETWVKSTIPLSISDTTIELGTQKQFIKDWFEERYIPVFKEALKTASGKDFEVSFVNLDTMENNESPIIYDTNSDSFNKTQANYLKFLEEVDNFSDDSSNGENDNESLQKNFSLLNNSNNTDKSKASDCFFDKNEIDISYTLNPKYIFSTFVVGNSNRLAHSASQAVAEAPAQIYNPLFIYGGVGLGKTHLMHAIGHSIRTNFPNLKVVYISSEKFTNELINSIRDGDPESFRQRYRYIDVLLIDDIQFLTKKERTQEEFFHTFNILHGNSKQIIISSDRLPNEIETLEDRLRSRFEWGLITDISPPDLETRIAVLRKKALLQNLDIPNDVILYIASLIKNNIRELEGAFIRVIAFASLNKRPIDIDLATEALKKLFPNGGSRQITVEFIKEIVASYFKIKIEDLAAKNRTRNITYPRQIAMYLSRELTEDSLPKIGQMFGGRDHTTVIHSHEKIGREKTSDSKLDITIKELIKRIKA